MENILLIIIIIIVASYVIGFMAFSYGILVELRRTGNVKTVARKRIFRRKPVESKPTREDIILANIDRYDGSSDGQREIE